MAEPSSAIQLLEQALDQFLDMRPILLTYTNLILSALLPIYAGAHASLSRPSSAAKPKKKTKTADEDEEEEEDDESSDKKPKMEGLEPSDAFMFPLVAGLTLGVLYFIIKWLEDPAVLNKILSFYFSQMGLFFTTAFLTDGLVVVRSFVFPTSYSSRGNQWKVEQSNMLSMASEGADQTRVERKSPLPGLLGAIPLPTAILGFLWTLRGLVYQKLRLRLKVRNLANIKTGFGILDVLGAGTAVVAVAYFAFVAKPWWMTNLLGFSFCYGSLQFMSPSTFLTGSLILSSLFLYDIYFVFFTPLMVTVATKLDVPIKLLIPRPADPTSDSKELSLAMLGLGDIVVPGMMIGLALRFDLYLYYKYKSMQKTTSSTESEQQDDTKPIYQNATGKWGERFWTCSKPVQSSSLEPPYSDAQAFPKPYFHASIVGYIVGMITTLTVMQFWNHAQPALLYLVPSVLISLWGTALCRGELGLMSAFSDATEDAEDEKSNGKDAETETAKPEDRRGLFARIWSGDVKAPFERTETSKDDDLQKEKETNSSSTAKTELSDDNKAASSYEEEPKKKDDASQRHIFSLSISLPKKTSGSQKTSSEGTGTD